MSTSRDDAREPQDEGQVSEAAGLRDPDGAVSDGDAVAGQPEGESGRADEGPTGPDAPTFDPEQGRHRGKGDVDTSG